MVVKAISWLPKILKITFLYRERSQMRSFKIQGFQTPSPVRHLQSQVTFARPPGWRHLSSILPSFPKMIFGKIAFYGKIEKLRNQDSTMIQILIKLLYLL